MSLPWSSKGLKGTPVNADELLIIDSADANPSTQNKRITIGTLPSATLPVPDTTAIVEGSLDATKLLRFEVDGFTTATTRILTPPNADGTIVLEDFAQTLTNKSVDLATNTLTGTAAQFNTAVSDDTIAFVSDNLSVFASTSSAQLAGVINDETGTGLLVFGTSPTLVTPALGTPSALVLTNATDLPVSGLADGTDGELITWDAAGVAATVAVGTTGQVLTSNGVGAPPTFQSAGSQTPWVSDIDAATFDLTNLSNIEFTTTTGAPGAGVQAIYADAGGIIINVPTLDTLLLKINDVGEYSFGVDDLDMQVNGLFDVENIVFAETLGAPAGTLHAIYVDAGGMIFNSANTDDFDFQINATSEYVLTTTQAEWNSNNLIEMGILSFTDVNTSLQQSVSDLLVDVATGGTISLRVNDVAEYTFDSTTADFNSNSIINATIDGDLNTVLDINETQMDVFLGASGFVLTSNGAGSPPTYQAVAGTGDVIGPAGATDNAIARFDTATGKLIQNSIITIDDVANVELIRSLQFISHTAAPGPTIEYIAVVNNDFEINVTTGNNFVLEVNETNEYTFDATSADFLGNNLIMGGAYIQFTSITTPGNSGAATVGRLFLDSGNLNHLTVRRNDGIDVDLEAASQTPWISNIDAAGFDLQSLSNLEFQETTGVPGPTVPSMYHEATGITVNVPTGDSISLDVNAVTEYIFDATQSDWNLNDFIEMGILSFTDVNTSLQQSVSDLLVDVATGGTITLRVNDVAEYNFDATTANFNSNSITNATIDGDLNTILDINETQMNVSVGVADTLLTSNGVGVAPTYESLFPINFPENAGGNATATQDIDFSINDRHSQQYTLTQNTTLTFSGTVASTTEYVDLFIVQDGTGGWTLTLPIGTVNKSEVEAGINLGAGEETFILLKFAFGTFYAFLQGSQTAGEVFTWTADHSMATFKLTATAANDVILNAPTGQGVSIEVAATEEYLFNATLADFNGNNLSNMGILSFDDVNTSLQQSASNLQLDVATGGLQVLRINDVTEYSFSATIADFNGNNIQDIPQILDSNGAELLIFTTTASAVNELTLVNAATLTPVEIQATGTDANVDVQFTPKGTGTFYGNRETWSWPLTDETTAPTTGVKFTTEPAPYDMSIEDAIAGLTTAGTGAALFTIDVLKENSVNADAFTTIFSTLVTIDASEFTSTTAATAPVISVSTWEKGRRLQLSIDTLDTDTLGRGAKISLVTHATAK